MTWECSNCGTINNNNDYYCKKCGYADNPLEDSH